MTTRRQAPRTSVPPSTETTGARPTPAASGSPLGGADGAVPKRRRAAPAASGTLPQERRRVVIEAVEPEVSSGRFPIKRTVGDSVVVEADIFADGHEQLRALLRYRRDEDAHWREIPMRALPNDRWRGEFTVDQVGAYLYTLTAWVDRFRSWQAAFAKKVEAGQDVSVDLLVGVGLIDEAAGRATRPDGKKLRSWAKLLTADARPSLGLDEALGELMDAHSDRRHATEYGRELTVWVDPLRARSSAWYEMFPRSASRDPGRHGTFADCERLLPYVADLGFDVLYLPPVHPIGRTNRKGPNNAPRGEPGDPGSPWAIGGQEGGHDSVHPELGTLKDFDRLVAKARDFGIEVALDIAFQCSPDHPYVGDHPEWFRRRPDGTLQYAENPPKKYEDIYPIDFETDAWRELWEELLRVVRFWIGHGVRIFRVDNPHTKPFAFWEWLIGEIKASHPDVLFLSEAFTRPKVMHRVAQIGFSHSYTYFTWRTTKAELGEYLAELHTTDGREYFRPHLWPNTPDILTEHLQLGGRPAFMSRLILAATGAANYGIYGPAFELCENRPLVPGREEYFESEKYQIRQWDLDDPASLAPLIAIVNRVRRQNPALGADGNLRLHPVDNDQLIAYSRTIPDLSNVVLVVVNLDPIRTQSGWVDLALAELGIDPGAPYEVHDLLTDARYLWHGPRNYVELNPHAIPAHIFRMPGRVQPPVEA